MRSTKVLKCDSKVAKMQFKKYQTKIQKRTKMRSTRPMRHTQIQETCSLRLFLGYKLQDKIRTRLRKARAILHQQQVLVAVGRFNDVLLPVDAVHKLR